MKKSIGPKSIGWYGCSKETKKKYFYAVTSLRRKRNRIDKLMKQGGEVCEREKEVAKEIS